VLGTDGAKPQNLRADAAAGALGDDRIMALASDEQGGVWAGTMTAGLVHIAADTRIVARLRHDAADPSSLPAAGVMSLLRDAQARLWVGTYGGGLAQLEPASGALHIPAPSEPLYALARSRITALAQDAYGRIWIGTDGDGVRIYDPVRTQLIDLHAIAAALAADTVYVLHAGPDGEVWIGTRGAGLYRAAVPKDLSAAAKNTTVSSYTSANGLPNNTVYGIVPDRSGQLWVSTNHGLASLDPASGTVHAYHRWHGLQAEEFNFGAYLGSRTGRLFFGGGNGYNSFDPAQLASNEVAPPVALTAVLSMDQPWKGYDASKLPPPLEFGYHDSVLTFEFAALDFTAPGENAFEYQLQGVDPDWIRAGTRRSVTYTYLPGGQYLLRARAANSDGRWNAAGLTIPVIIDPPPWKSRIAYACYALLLLALLAAAWGAHQRSLRQAAAYNQRLEREVSDRTRQLAERNQALQRVNSQLEEVSYTDALTGLGNRRALSEAMPLVIGSLGRRKADESRLALLLIDLDRLKPINDQYGHAGGDRLLVEVAAILKRCVRAEDKVVRWGGDEFVVVHAVEGLDEAATLAERIRFSVSKCRFSVAGNAGQVVGRTSCSIGFGLYPFVAGSPPVIGWERVLSIADSCLYAAKARRNAWVGCSGNPSSLGRGGEVELLLEENLEAAERAGYVSVRRSRPAIDETVELLLRAGPARD
jgi:diguanylate cyclase (GGDEF)-like protein